MKSEHKNESLENNESNKLATQLAAAEFSNAEAAEIAAISDLKDKREIHLTLSKKVEEIASVATEKIALHQMAIRKANEASFLVESKNKFVTEAQKNIFEKQNDKNTSTSELASFVSELSRTTDKVLPKLAANATKAKADVANAKEIENAAVDETINAVEAVIFAENQVKRAEEALYAARTTKIIAESKAFEASVPRAVEKEMTGIVNHVARKAVELAETARAVRTRAEQELTILITAAEEALAAEERRIAQKEKLAAALTAAAEVQERIAETIAVTMERAEETLTYERSHTNNAAKVATDEEILAVENNFQNEELAIMRAAEGSPAAPPTPAEPVAETKRPEDVPAKAATAEEAIAKKAPTAIVADIKEATDKASAAQPAKEKKIEIKIPVTAELKRHQVLNDILVELKRLNPKNNCFDVFIRHAETALALKTGKEQINFITQTFLPEIYRSLNIKGYQPHFLVPKRYELMDTYCSDTSRAFYQIEYVRDALLYSLGFTYICNDLKIQLKNLNSNEISFDNFIRHAEIAASKTGEEQFKYVAEIFMPAVNHAFSIKSHDRGSLVDRFCSNGNRASEVMREVKKLLGIGLGYQYDAWIKLREHIKTEMKHNQAGPFLNNKIP